MDPRYNPQQLRRLFRQMAGGGLWFPQSRERKPYVGPAFAVYLKYTDLFPESGDVAERYWHLLQEVPVINAIGVLAAINNVLAVASWDRSAHEVLHQHFLEPSVAERVTRNSPEAPAFSVVFHRLGSVVAIHDLLLYGANRASAADSPITQIGALALCANDFVERDPVPAGTATNLELATQVIRTWDVYNPRDLAYAMTRTHTLFTAILPSSEQSIVKLRDRIGMNNLVIDGLTLPEFVAIAFALFAHGNVIGKDNVNRVIVEPAAFFREFPRAQPLLDKFLAGRALTVEQLTDKLAGDAPRTRERFLAATTGRSALKASLAVFRQQPLLQLSDGRVVILDLQFLTDLVTTGIYWLIFDTLLRQRRATFRELWGRCFELYVTDLLREFYPVNSHFLSTDVQYPSGQIDALLDFGTDVFVFEIKSSLLTEAAKRSGDPRVLAADVERKFIRNERGAPKAVVQLARAAGSVVRGLVRTAIPPRRIYPVLITDEPGCECLGFNAYLNERFQEEAVDLAGVRPLTIMSINECEELLPYCAANSFSWAELCETRFNEGQVTVWSMHQAIHDLRHARHISVHRNDYILKRFEAIYHGILQSYGVDKAVPRV
jgi:hypothetical protein